MSKFSVLMSVYVKEKPEFFDLALESITSKQTIMPDEIVIVKDGPLTKELDLIIKKYMDKYKNLFHIIPLEKNMGLGYALNIGLEQCKNEIVMRMDTDDISLSDRFEIQLKFMNEHKDVIAVGGSIAEFKEDYINENKRIKEMPLTSNDIIKYSKFRCPINHMTVCFRKSEILKVGGYKPLLYVEDYYLWARLLVNNKKLANIPEILVNVRIGNGFNKRRGQKKIISSWKILQKYMYENKFINYFEKERNMLGVRCIVYAPSCIKDFLYKKYLRKNDSKKG